MNQIANSISQIDLENLDKDALLELLLEQENQNQSLIKKVIELEETNTTLMHYLKLAQAARFGSKSEKVSDDEETPMLPGIGQVFDEASVDVETKKPAKKRAAQGGRKPLPDHLPRDEVTHDIEEHEKVCPCGHLLNCIGKEEPEQLEIIPAQVKLLKMCALNMAAKLVKIRLSLQRCLLKPFQKPWQDQACFPIFWYRSLMIICLFIANLKCGNALALTLIARQWGVGLWAAEIFLCPWLTS